MTGRREIHVTGAGLKKRSAGDRMDDLRKREPDARDIKWYNKTPLDKGGYIVYFVDKEIKHEG